jgi:hypothetical protein
VNRRSVGNSHAEQQAGRRPTIHLRDQPKSKLVRSFVKLALRPLPWVSS